MTMTMVVMVKVVKVMTTMLPSPRRIEMKEKWNDDGKKKGRNRNDLLFVTHMNGFLSMWISFYCYVLQIEVRRYKRARTFVMKVLEKEKRYVCIIIFAQNLNAVHITRLLLLHFTVVEIIWKSFWCYRCAILFAACRVLKNFWPDAMVSVYRQFILTFRKWMEFFAWAFPLFLSLSDAPP